MLLKDERGADVLLSVVCVLENEDKIEDVLRVITDVLQKTVVHYEIVLVNNSLNIEVVSRLKLLSKEIQNLQVYCLMQPRDYHTAIIAGLENAIGDYVILLHPEEDDPSLIPVLLTEATSGYDVVYAKNTEQYKKKSFIYKQLSSFFYWLCKKVYSGSAIEEILSYQIISRTVVNFILQHKMTHVLYQVLPVIGKINCKTITYCYPIRSDSKTLLRSIWSRLAILRAGFMPLRLVSWLALVSAVLIFFHVGYTLFVSSTIAEIDVIFFIFSIIFWLLSDYFIGFMEGLISPRLYCIKEEFSSSVITRKQQVNVVEDEPLK